MSGPCVQKSLFVLCLGLVILREATSISGHARFIPAHSRFIGGKPLIILGKAGLVLVQSGDVLGVPVIPLFASVLERIVLPFISACGRRSGGSKRRSPSAGIETFLGSCRRDISLQQHFVRDLIRIDDSVDIGAQRLIQIAAVPGRDPEGHGGCGGGIHIDRLLSGPGDLSGSVSESDFHRGANASADLRFRVLQRIPAVLQLCLHAVERIFGRAELLRTRIQLRLRCVQLLLALHQLIA